MKKMKKTLCGFLVCLLLVAATPLLANAAAKAPVCPKTQALYFERSAPYLHQKPFIYSDHYQHKIIQHILHSLQTSRIKCDPDWHKHEISHERPQG